MVHGKEVILDGCNSEAGWPVISLKDQITAILNAPIPFIVVCVAALASAWGMMQWLYKERMEKTKHLFDLSTKEIEIKTEIAARIQDELKKDVESLKKGLDESKSHSPEILALTKEVSSLQLKVGELAQANTAVSNAVGRGLGMVPPRHSSRLEGARTGFGMPPPK